MSNFKSYEREVEEVIGKLKRQLNLSDKKVSDIKDAIRDNQDLEDLDFFLHIVKKRNFSPEKIRSQLDLFSSDPQGFITDLIYLKEKAV